ncbi:hypothetical protein OROMI_030831 [Orobanche minor]
MKMLINSLFFASSCRTRCYSLCLNPFRYSALSSQPIPHIRNHNCEPLRSRRYSDGSCLSRSASIKSIMCASPPSVHVRDHIDLTDKEKQIFDRLLQVLRHFNLQNELRVAGGWVRDKLLGKECYDIDIAIDGMLGKEFCDKVNEYLSSTGDEAYKFVEIASNPDQSKHLETAKMRIFDVSIDFVNLRSEDYSDHSRIPKMRFGNAKDDAYRRDLTINSLFYNINTSSMEDFTERGIADLKAGKIVTPLSPKKTFLDDPLRVLRAIRFGARFGFVLDEELKTAAADHDVRDALSSKISRERIGREIDLMISGPQPVMATTYISELQLFRAVFSLPSVVEPPTPEGCERLSVAYMDTTWRYLKSVGSSFNDEQRRLCLYAALFLPFRSAVYTVKKDRDTDKESKRVKNPVVSYIFHTSLKLANSDAETVMRLHVAAEKFLSLIPSLISDGTSQILEVDKKHLTIDVPVSSKLRVFSGLLLREIKEFWRAAVVLSLLLYPQDIGSSKNLSVEDTEVKEAINLYDRIENAILEMELEKVWDLKPLVNGKEIMNILQLKKGGPIVGEWQQKLLQWQLAYPSGSAEECIDWMRQTQSKRARTE